MLLPQYETNGSTIEVGASQLVKGSSVPARNKLKHFANVLTRMLWSSSECRYLRPEED